MSTVVAGNFRSTSSGAPAFKNSSGTEVGQLIKAWARVANATSDLSLVEDFNVTSVVDTATGRFSVNFTNSFSSVNYVMAGSAGSSTTLTPTGKFVDRDGAWTTAIAKISVLDKTGNHTDCDYVGLIFAGA